MPEKNTIKKDTQVELDTDDVKEQDVSVKEAEKKN